MPYSSPEELPPTVKVLPSGAQKIWMAVFNDALNGDTCKSREDPEVCAIKMAWGAVKRQYTRDSSGTWREKANKIPICTRGFRCKKNPQHRLVLQKLNSWIEYDNGDTYLALENFTGTEAKWDKAHLLYGLQHPSMKALLADPDAEIARAGLQKAGVLKESEVFSTGQPRAESTAEFHLPEVEKLWREGRLGVSTGFFALPDGEGGIEGKVEPNHVLLFPIDDENQPRDPGAYFLNKRGQEAPMDEYANEGKVISRSNAEALRKAIASLKALFKNMTGEEPEEQPPEKKADVKEKDSKKKEVENMDETKLAELQNQITEKDAALAKLQKEMEAKDQQLKEYLQKAANERWAATKARLRPGVLKKEPEEKVRERFENDPYAFINMLLEVKTPDEQEEEGETFLNKQKKDAEKQAEQDEKDLQEFRERTGRL